MRAGIAVGAALVLVLAPDLAEACSCIQPPPPAQALEQASAVFEGTALTNELAPDRSRRTVSMRVERTWKGPRGPEIQVITAGDSAMCGVHFELGKKYLVYAGDMGGELAVSLCSRTRPSEQAADDIAALDGIASGSGGGQAVEETPPSPSSDPAISRPAPETLAPRENVPDEPQSGGCACGGKSHVDIHTAAMLPFFVVRMMRKKRS